MKKSVYTSEYESLRSELRNARASAGLSQRELATRLKVPHSWVAKVESGERRIDLVEFCWFLMACGFDPLPLSDRLIRRIAGRHARRKAKGGASK